MSFVGIMTNRPMLVHSSGMEVVVAMTTVLRRKRSARTYVSMDEQVFHRLLHSSRISVVFHF